MIGDEEYSHRKTVVEEWLKKLPPTGEALRGRAVFEKTCAQCHGTYGPEGKYPNRMVPLEVVGTDSVRLKGLTKEFRAYFSRTWFAQNSSHAEEEPPETCLPSRFGNLKANLS